MFDKIFDFHTIHPWDSRTEKKINKYINIQLLLLIIINFTICHQFYMKSKRIENRNRPKFSNQQNINFMLFLLSIRFTLMLKLCCIRSMLYMLINYYLFSLSNEEVTHYVWISQKSDLLSKEVRNLSKLWQLFWPRDCV